jgi:hypothetical protein
LGTFIWEPTKWPMGNPALFDENGRTKAAIQEFTAFRNSGITSPLRTAQMVSQR